MAFIKIVAIGNVGKDPVINTMPSGATVANFSIASTEKWKDKTTGEAKDHTEWLKCSAIGGLADVVAQYVKQGSKLYLEGKYKSSKYVKDGVEVTSVELRIDQMEMLGETKGNQQQGNQQQGNQAQPQQQGGYQRPQQQQQGGYQQPQQQQQGGYQQRSQQQGGYNNGGFENQ